MARCPLALAEIDLQYLHNQPGLELAAGFQPRPRSARVLAQHARCLPRVDTLRVDPAFGGWSQAHKQHFNDGALYDPVIAAAKAH